MSKRMQNTPVKSYHLQFLTTECKINQEVSDLAFDTIQLSINRAPDILRTLQPCKFNHYTPRSQFSFLSASGTAGPGPEAPCIASDASSPTNPTYKVNISINQHSNQYPSAMW